MKDSSNEHLAENKNEQNKAADKFEFNLNYLNAYKGIEESIYFDVLNKALHNDDVQNIAITGPYGSGKSSVIESYKKQHLKGEKHFNISLATFSTNNTKAEKENTNSIEDSLYNNKNYEQGKVLEHTQFKKSELEKKLALEKDIETSIIQQFYYQIQTNDIPYSRFNKIEKLSTKKITWISIKYAIWLGLIFFAITNNIFTIGSYKEPLHYLYLIINILILSGLVCSFVSITKLIKKGKVKKISFKSSSLELSGSKQDSILNKHLDELIYFFDETECKIVFIEDLDRFNNLELFTKLKEINYIINSAIDNPNKIKFVYAIRDGLFDEETERTKFFDIIIPIIPIADTSNSNEKLKEIFKDSGYVTVPLQENFINDISLYIYDMRLLKNIVNEFCIYDNMITTKNRKKENTFALILFKNLFPNHFNDLHEKKGLLYDIFKSKKTILVEKVSEDLNNKLSTLKNELNELYKETNETIESLKSEYINQIIVNNYSIAINGIYINGKNTPINNIINKENFDILINDTNITLHTTNNQKQKTNYSFLQIEKDVNTKKTYSEREIIINKKNSNLINETTYEITNVSNKLKRIRNIQLKGLIRLANSYYLKGILFSTYQEENLNSDYLDLLIYLLKHGYISKDYNNYLSHFYDGSITLNDKEFLLNIKNNGDSNFTYKIEKPQTIIESIYIEDFESKAILNYSLFENIINLQDQLKIDLLFSQFKNESETAINFTFSFIQFLDKKGKEYILKVFLLNITASWARIWNYSDDKTVIDLSYKKRFLYLLLTNLNANDSIEEINSASNSKLSDYVLSLDDFFEIFPNKTSIEISIDLLNVKFKSVKFNTKLPHNLIDYIYALNYYEINYNMVLNMILYNSNNSQAEQIKSYFNSKNYTCINNSRCPKLIEYINSNLDIYVNSVYLQLDRDQKEDQKAFIKLINSDLSHENKMNIIDKNNTYFEDIDVVNDRKLFDKILEQNQMKANWHNINIYFKENNLTINSILAEFIYTNEINLSKDVTMQITVNDAIDIGKELLYSSLITRDTINNIYSSNIVSNIMVEEYYLDKINEEKIEFLIENEPLFFSIENYNQLKKLYHPLNIYLIVHNYDKFFDVENNDFPSWQTLDLYANDYLSLLSESTTSAINKTKIIDILSEEYLRNTELSDIILKFITDDEYYKLEYSFIKKLIEFGTSLKLKILLIINVSKRLKYFQIRLLIQLLESPFKQIVEPKVQIPKIIENDINIKFANELKELLFIKRYKIEKGYIKMYKG